MKISAKVREQAAMILAVAASTTRDQYDAWDALGIPTCGSVSKLTQAAIDVVYSRMHRAWPIPWDELYAEAEALLRTGWTP